MFFPDSYFEDEVREGFYVNGMMKRAWAAQLEVLSEVDKVCKRHGIRWFADCGTLLGAVRHGGYIPWDDDLDICMLRDDYIKFINATSELPEGYCVLTLDSEPDYYEMLARVCNGHTINTDDKRLERYHQFPFAVGIDVFPLDYVAPDPENEQTRLKLISIVSAATNALDNESSMQPDSVLELVESVEKLCNVIFDRTRSLKKQLYQLMEKLFMLYTPGISGCKDIPDEVVLMPYWHKNGSHKYKKSYFDHIVNLPFEMTNIQAPAMYDSVLKIEYGSYLACRQGGGVHDYPFFKEQERQLISAGPYYPFRYDFTEKDLCSDVERGKKPVVRLRDFVNAAACVQDTVAGLLSEDRFAEVLNLILSCRNAASVVGDVIGRAYGQDFVTMGLLRDYDRCALNMCNAVNARDEAMVQEAYSATDEVLVRLSDNASALGNVREVVFVTYKPEQWRFVDRIWKSFQNDPSVIVSVVPIPYYYRDMKGNFTKMVYEVDGYPDYVKLTMPEDYDFAARHPDMIFVQNSFDGGNYTESIQPDFYSDRLKKVTDTLVYVQSFETDNIEPDNEKGMLAAGYFVKTPGVVNADFVVVPSDSMKDTYIRILTDYAGNNTRGVWEQKIISPADWRPAPEDHIKDIPDEWKRIILKPDGTRKKVMLYRISTSPLMEFGLKATDKIKSSLDIFYDRRDQIALILMPEDCLWNSLEDCKEVYNEFRTVVEDYVNDGWGIYAGDKDRQAALNVCDAYYGDAGNLVRKFRRAGKPVMIEDINI